MTEATNKQPFLSRNPVWDVGNFIGRKNETDWVADKLSRGAPQNCNITAEPRQGQTSFLYRIYAQQVGLPADVRGLYVWVRLVEMADFSSMTFWRFLIDQLNAAAKQNDLPLIEDVDDLESESDLFDALDEAIEELIEDEELGRLIFVVDDFDVVTPGLTSRDLDWLRALANRYQTALAFVIGSTDSLVSLTNQIIQRETGESSQAISPFANFFHNRPLGLLTEADAVALCEKADDLEPSVPLSYDDIQFLLKEAGRHPDLLKLGLSHLFATKPLSEPDELYEDVAGDLRFDSAAQGLSRTLFERLTPAQRDVMIALSRGDDEEELDRTLLTGLRRQSGLIEKRDSRYTPFSDTFAYWLGRLSKEVVQKQEAAEEAESEEEEMFQYLPEQRSVRLPTGELSRLTPLENRLLVYFIEHANQVCTIEELLRNVWGPNKSRAVVEKAVNRLRTKVETDPKRPRFILSARGEGYLLRYEPS